MIWGGSAERKSGYTIAGILDGGGSTMSEQISANPAMEGGSG